VLRVEGFLKTGGSLQKKVHAANNKWKAPTTLGIRNMPESAKEATRASGAKSDLFVPKKTLRGLKKANIESPVERKNKGLQGEGF